MSLRTAWPWWPFPVSLALASGVVSWQLYLTHGPHAPYPHALLFLPSFLYAAAWCLHEGHTPPIFGGVTRQDSPALFWLLVSLLCGFAAFLAVMATFH